MTIGIVGEKPHKYLATSVYKTEDDRNLECFYRLV